MPKSQKLTANQKLKARANQLMKLYGITLQQYDEMLLNQNESCAVCNKHKSEESRNFAVDHNHHTGEIRGLLCGYCNRRLVGRHRDANILRKIADYIEQGTGLFVPKKPRKRSPRKLVE